MTIKHIEASHTDKRGTITDIFVHDPKDHGLMVTTFEGYVRGNHYHKLSTQSDYIVSGKVMVYSQMPGEPVLKRIAIAGDYITHAPGEAHAFKALENTITMTFVSGPRGGKDYESDTVRLETPLV